MNTALTLINEWLTSYLVLPGLLLLGVYLTFRLRFVQISKLKLGFAHLFKKDEGQAEGDISHYQAVASVLASNFGTGNISGMAIALAMGGPGALIWMWVMTFLGSAVQFANCLLGVKYRRRNSEGEFVGGPMYYLKSKKVATLFSLFVILAGFGVSCAQVNAMSLPLETFGLSPWIMGVAVALFVAAVIFGGGKRVAQVSSAVVPVMAALYFGAALVILCMHYEQLLPAIGTLFRSTFGGGAAVGGTLGYTVMKSLTTGFDRGIFATDAGTGTVPILQAGAKSKHPVVDGVVSLTAPFLVMIVCTATALVLMVTGAYQEPGMMSTNMVLYAFKKSVGASTGGFIVICSLILFGYTTVLAWATCIERAVGFLWGRHLVRPFHCLFILLIPMGTLLHAEFVWILADIALTSMLVLNMVGVAGLSREVIEDTQLYFKESGDATIESRV